MTTVFIRGKAMTWVYLCDQCKQKLFKGDDRKKPNCSICGEKFSASLDMPICNMCSYETKMCMSCGCNIKIGDDFDTMLNKAMKPNPKSKKKRRKKRKV